MCHVQGINSCDTGSVFNKPMEIKPMEINIWYHSTTYEKWILLNPAFSEDKTDA